MTTADAAPAPLAPLERAQRIEALDVVRGFALIGILLMNIEFFNRATQEIGMGMQPGLTGANYWFSWFVQYFVVGKFWTIFSLLFGMGFAVMLMRAENSGRDFFRPYLRRIAALAVFGALHFLFLWSGDILFSYAVGALALLIVLYGQGNHILLGVGLLASLSAMTKLEWPFIISSCLGYFGVCAWYLRCPDRIALFGRDVPVFKIVTRFLTTGAVAALLARLLVPSLPHGAKLALPIVGIAVLILSILMARYHQPPEARPWRMAVGLYVFSVGLMTALAGAEYYYPDPADAVVAKPFAAAPAVSQAPALMAENKAASDVEKATTKKPPSDAEKAAEKRKKRAEQIAEHNTDVANELRVLTKGSYADVIAMRARDFVKHAPDQFAFAVMLINMFLLGLWFVRSGIMADTRAHRPLFLKLAMIAMPVGVGLGLLGAQIATHDILGQRTGFHFAFGLLMLGNLGACLGYVSVVILMLDSGSALSRIRILAPFGRMALTNYLTHSLVFSTIFYGYGLGYFGIERLWQLACVAAMVAVQIALSHWWLRHFRYGPVEWLWRAITYWQIPAMRVAPAGNRGSVPRAV